MSERLHIPSGMRNLVLTAALIGVPTAAVSVVMGLDGLGGMNQRNVLTPPNRNETSPSNGAIVIFETPTPTEDQTAKGPWVGSNRLERRIEDRFDITLLTVSEYTGERIKVKHEGDWNVGKLSLFKGALRQLPKHFYEKKGNHEDLTIVLLPNEELNAFCICMPNAKRDDGSVQVNKEIFKYGQKLVTQILAHELAHSIQPWKTDKPGSRRYKDYTSSWVSARDRILGDGKSAARKIINRVLEQRPNVWEVDVEALWTKSELTDEEKKDFFAARMAYATGYSVYKYWNKKTYDSELFGVLAEAYVNGPEYFSDFFGRFTGPEEVRKLYDFTGSEMFGGWQYKDGIAISRPLEDNS